MHIFIKMEKIEDIKNFKSARNSKRNIEKLSEFGKKILMDGASERFVSLRDATRDYQRLPDDVARANLRAAIADYENHSNYLSSFGLTMGHATVNISSYKKLLDGEQE